MDENARSKGLGGSDAPVVLGISKWKTPLQLYQEKTATRRYTVENDAVQWGKILEAVVAAEYARRTGHKIARVNSTIVHPDHPWMLGNIDRRVLNQDGGMLLEVKTAGKWADMTEWGEDGTSDIPKAYMAQVQHYLAVTGWARADLVVLLAGQDFRTYHIKRDDGFIAHLIEAEQDFWIRVLERNPPEPVDVEDAVRRWPQDDAQTTIATDEVAQAVSRLRDLQDHAKELDASIDEAKLFIQKAMADKAFLVDASGKALATWKTQESTRLDTKAIKAAHPEIASQFEKTTPSRVFRLK